MSGTEYLSFHLEEEFEEDPLPMKSVPNLLSFDGAHSEIDSIILESLPISEDSTG